MLYHTALVTLASVLFYVYLCAGVARARGQYSVAAPATTGHPVFERLYRIQMNTLEWMVVYLPCLWLFGFYVSDAGAGLLGLLWIFGRYLYKRGYEEAPERRHRGFMIQAAAASVLFLGALIDIFLRMAIGD
jgi:glutathione S-transferase